MDEPLPQTLLQARQPGVLNRVLNLETGSLAVEAALKMMLSRFDTLDGSAPAYPDRIPVFLVMADNDGGVTAGYHGTTILAQILRGLWPSLAENAKTHCASSLLRSTIPKASAAPSSAGTRRPIRRRASATS